MFLYSSAGFNIRINPFKTAVPFWGQIAWNLSEIYVSLQQCTTKRVLKIKLTRLRLQSGFGDKLGIRGRYMFLYSALLL